MVTTREKCRFLDELKHKGANISYDTALPIDWVNDVMEKTGRFPYGVVWLYDGKGLLGPKCGIFGRPYSVSMYGYCILKIYQMKGGDIV
jgi:hypothetical protein